MFTNLFQATWWTLVPKQKSYSAHIDLTELHVGYTVSWRKFIRHVVLGYCFSFASCHCCDRNFEYLNWLSTRTCGAGRPHVWLCHAPLVQLWCNKFLHVYSLQDKAFRRTSNPLPSTAINTCQCITRWLNLNLSLTHGPTQVEWKRINNVLLTNVVYPGLQFRFVYRSGV